MFKAIRGRLASRVMLPNKALVPTRKSATLLLAAQR